MLQPAPALQRLRAGLPSGLDRRRGPAPLIATALYAATGSPYSIAFYILGCAVVSVVATLFLPDYTNRDISQETAYRAAPALALGSAAQS
jgi:hypothetical protein